MAKNMRLILLILISLALFAVSCTSSSSSPDATGSEQQEESHDDESTDKSTGTLELPASMSIVTYSTGTGAYVETAALATAFRELGVTMRVLPADTEIERWNSILEGTADLVAGGGGIVFAQDGVAEFATPELGPQPIRMVWSNNYDNFGCTLILAGDAGIDTPYDLAGKRVAWIPGLGAANMQTTAYMAFGNVTWDDVIRVEYPSLQEGFQGIIDGRVDAVHGCNTTSAATEIGASPRGVNLLRFPLDDEEGWKRTRSMAPWLSPTEVTTDAAGVISEDKPYGMPSYPYPIHVASPNTDASITYGFAKLVNDAFDLYKDSSLAMPGHHIDNQVFPWLFPVHEGVIQYLKEQGRWTEENQQLNDLLIERQERLAEEWEKFMSGEGSSLSGTELAEAWDRHREENGLGFAALAELVAPFHK